MLDISETIIDYLVAETRGENEIDEALKEVMAWRKRNKDSEQELKKKRLDTARTALVDASIAYQDAMAKYVGEPVPAAEAQKSREQLEADLRKSEALLTGLLSLKQSKPAADKVCKCQSDEDKLKAFLEGLK